MDKWREVSNTALDPDDLRDVLSSVHTLRSRAYHLGICLGLSLDVIDAIESQKNDPDMLLSKILHTWLKMNYNTSKCGRPSWRLLCYAVDSSVGGADPALARKIAANNPAQVSRKMNKRPFEEDLTSPIDPRKKPFAMQQIGAEPFYSKSTYEESFDSPYKRLFECGCGKCDLNSLLKVGCPSPKNEKLPILKFNPTHELAKKLHEGKIWELEQKTTNIHNLFVDCLHMTTNKLVDKPVSIESMKKFLHAKLYSTHDITELEEVTNHNQLFRYLIHQLSWYNYQLLEEMSVEFLGDDKTVMSTWKSYKKNLQEYSKDRLEEYEGVFFGLPESEDNQVILFKIDPKYSKMKLNEIGELRSSMCNILGRPYTLLYFVTVIRGSVILKFLVPSTSYKLLFPLSKEHEKKFAKLGLVQISEAPSKQGYSMHSHPSTVTGSHSEGTDSTESLLNRSAGFLEATDSSGHYLDPLDRPRSSSTGKNPLKFRTTKATPSDETPFARPKSPIAGASSRMETLFLTNRPTPELQTSPKLLDLTQDQFTYGPITALNIQLEPELIGGYEVEAVDTIPSSLECPICKLALRDPQVIDCPCGSHFCTTCLLQQMQHGGNNCPVCKGVFHNHAANNQIKRKVEGLKVYCQQQKFGCPWIGELRNLQNHLQKDCQYASATAVIIPSLVPLWQTPPPPGDSSHIPTLPFEFTMTHFSQHQSAGRDWFSPPFYTHSKGYKMCLSVKPDGWWPGEKGTRSSIHAHLMKGKYDNDLSFPFHGDLTMEVLNWREDKEHITGTFSFQDIMAAPCEKVVSGEKNPAGWWLPYSSNPAYSSMAYNPTTNTEFLRNDCLRLRVNGVASYTPPPFIRTPAWKAVCEFTVTEFSKRKKYSNHYLSQPFYTHDGGYKICIALYPNGYSSKRGKYVSIGLQLLRGEHDHQLKWPFHGEAIVELLNWREDRNHYKCNVSLNPIFKNSCSRVVHEEMARTAVITTDAILHTALAYNPKENTEYLRNNQLQFRVKEFTSFNALLIPKVPQWQDSSLSIFKCTLSDFNKRKYFNSLFMSTPFYTHENGYKVCLQVETNGEANARNTHLSVFTALMNGENDDELQWPLQCNLVVELLNWREDKGHHKKVICFDGNSKHSYRVTEREVGERNGFIQYILQSSLPYNPATNTEYLKHDCLRFRVKMGEFESCHSKLTPQTERSPSQKDLALQLSVDKTSKSSNPTSPVKKHSLGTAPDMKALLLNVASKVQRKYMSIGTMLEIPEDQLMKIEQDHESYMDCYRIIFHKWKEQQNVPYTWEAMIDVLDSPVVECQELAQELRQLLKTVKD